MAVTTRDVVLGTADGSMRLYEARPDSRAKAAVIIVHEAFGVNDHIEDVSRRAAAAGFHAVAPDLFHRSGLGTVPYRSDVATLLKMNEGLSDATIVSDLDAAFAHLADAGFDASACGLIGFCFGGRVAFLAAARRAFGASVGFYGGGIVRATKSGNFPALLDQVPTMRTPFLGLHGDLDEIIPAVDVHALRDRLRADAPVAADVVIYHGARHGFHCDARPRAFDEAAAVDAWARALRWLDEHVVTREGAQ
jgi:carboxymethylenebutenolidase